MPASAAGRPGPRSSTHTSTPPPASRAPTSTGLPAGAKLLGVGQQVDENLGQRVGLAEHLRQRLRQPAHQLLALLAEAAGRPRRSPRRAPARIVERLARQVEGAALEAHAFEQVVDQPLRAARCCAAATRPAGGRPARQGAGLSRPSSSSSIEASWPASGVFSSWLTWAKTASRTRRPASRVAFLADQHHLALGGRRRAAQHHGARAAGRHQVLGGLGVAARAGVHDRAGVFAGPAAARRGAAAARRRRSGRAPPPALDPQEAGGLRASGNAAGGRGRPRTPLRRCRRAASRLRPPAAAPRRWPAAGAGASLRGWRPAGRSRRRRRSRAPGCRGRRGRSARPPAPSRAQRRHQRQR